MSNPFADVAQHAADNSIGGDRDSLGGSYIWDTDAYLVTVKNAYAGESAGGARSMTFEVEGADGRKFKFTEWVTSGKAKGQLPYYEKDGKKNYLPGFNNANAIAMFTTKKEMHALTFEEKMVKLRKKGEQQEVPTPTQVAVEMIGKQIILGIQKIETNKTVGVDNGKGGKDYKRTAETKFENSVDKIFFADNKATIAELREAKAKGVACEPKFHDEWVAKFAGTVKNDVKPAEVATPTAGGAPAPTGTDGGEVDSLFS